MKNNSLLLCFLLSGCVLLSGCSKGDVLIETGEVSEVLSTTASITGHILSVGDGIKHYGHCYATTADPTVSDAKTEFSVAIGEGSYTSVLYGLQPTTTYYVKAYASFDNSTVYGSVVSFTTSSAVTP